MATEILLTPTEGGDSIALSRTMFRKKILPLGTIDYKGRKIKFDRQYLTDLASSFHDGAFDQVPFMLADKDNAHTMDPERYRGDIKGVEVGEDGLYGLLELQPDAAELVRKNPNLGVSARIVEGYDRADGKSFSRAMQHVLGTLDPRIPGLGAWQEVALSGYDGDAQVLNLTQSTYEGAEMPQKQPEGNVPDVDLSKLTDEDLAKLLASLPDDEDEDDEDDTDMDDKTRTPVGASLSNDHPAMIELANQRTELAKLKAEAATARFDAERERYIQTGVPPYMVDLARPILEASVPTTIDLSNGIESKTVDAGQIVREMLSKMAGTLELARERGYNADFSNSGESDEDKERQNTLKLWADQFGK